MNNVQAVFFDVDDTLFDRRGAQREIVRRIVRRLPRLFGGMDEAGIIDAFLESDGLSLKEYRLGASPGRLRARRTQIFLDLLGLKHEHTDCITDMYVNEYPRIDVPVAGAVDMVERLAATYPLGVITNGLPDVQYAKLEALRIRHLFDCIVLSEEVGVEKPDPRIFHHAASLLEVAPERSLHVGDSYDADVVGARNAGMMACWYNPSASPAPRAHPVPDITVDRLEGILRWLGTA